MMPIHHARPAQAQGARIVGAGRTHGRTLMALVVRAAPEIRDHKVLAVRAMVGVQAIRRHRGQHGPQKTPTKELISRRVDRDVAAAYRASVPGWQTRANEALRAYAKKVRLGTRALRRGVVTRRAAPKHP